MIIRGATTYRAIPPYLARAVDGRGLAEQHFAGRLGRFLAPSGVAASATTECSFKLTAVLCNPHPQDPTS